jgi:lipoprotein-anchoring transpeptidase ErfK/SrfK
MSIKAPAPAPAGPVRGRFERALRSLAIGRSEVAFEWPYPVGSIVVVNRERALYHVGPARTAIRYPVAIGTQPEEWTGVEFVTDKKQNPTWHPVVELGKEIRDPVPGGDPTNPLGARALYLGRTLWRIHGTPAAESIGQAVSNGCIRMHNEHVIELFDNVMLGTEVYVVERLGDAPPRHRGRKLVEPTFEASLRR